MSQLTSVPRRDRVVQATGLALMGAGLCVAYAVAAAALVLMLRWLSDLYQHGLLLVIAGVVPGLLLALVVGTMIAVPLYLCGVLLILRRTRPAPSTPTMPAASSSQPPPNSAA